MKRGKEAFNEAVVLLWRIVTFGSIGGMIVKWPLVGLLLLVPWVIVSHVLLNRCAKPLLLDETR